MLKANGTLPHWHWQPEDLQQSCLSVEVFGEAFACGAPCDEAACGAWSREDALCDDWSCMGQASSVAAAAGACATTGSAADVTAA
jgi:hypothetical protein